MESLANYFNNPGNIKPPKGVEYEGQVGVDPDTGLAIFETVGHGRKALEKDIGIKIARGILTPEAFVDAYAPAGDENSEEARDNYKIALAEAFGLNDTSSAFPKDSVSKIADVVSKQEGFVPTEEAAPTVKPPSEAPKGNQTESKPDAQKNFFDEAFKDRYSAEKSGAMVGGAFGLAKYPVWAAGSRIYRAYELLGRMPASTEEAEQVLRAAANTTQSNPEPLIRPEKPDVKEKSGDKWNRKITSGPGGDTVTEAAANWRTQRDLPSEIAKTHAVSSAGLLEPLEWKTPNLPEDEKIKRMIEAQRQRIESQTDPIRMQMIEAQRQAQSWNRPATAGLTKMQRAQNFVMAAPAAAGRGAVRVLGSVPFRLGAAGASAAGNLQDFMTAREKGDTAGQYIAGTGGLGAALSLVPKINPVGGLVAGGADVARRAREGDYTGAAVSGGATLAPWAIRALGGLEFGPAGSVVAMGAPMVYDAARVAGEEAARRQEEAARSPQSARAYRLFMNPYSMFE